MIAEVLTINEINERFPDEWVLIGDPETDESLEVVRGKVLCHSKSRNEVNQAAIDLPAPKRIAVRYPGALFENDVEYIL